MTADNSASIRERIKSPAGRALVVIFLVALAVRWTYAIALQASMGTSSFLSDDPSNTLPSLGTSPKN